MFGLRNVARASKPGDGGHRKVRPCVEGLEDRMLLYATTGGFWSYGSRITYSLVPDGTSVGGVSSTLNSTLNATGTNWQLALQKAAVVWESVADINLAQVSDGGQPLGTSGNQQGDSRFGDIRIAMIPQSGGTLAFATLPPPFNGGTNAGDIVFNSNINWASNGIDLQTVAIHELGHVLGMSHSAISTADMYAYYIGVKQSLTGDDTSGIISVYGAYPGDPVDNGSFATATDITSQINASAQVTLPDQSLAGPTDSDYFVVTVPANTNGTMTVSMQATNLSSVTPRITVYGSNRVGIGQTSLSASYGGTATYSLNSVTPGQVYYFRALAGATFGSYGAYGLLVNFGPSSQVLAAPPNTVVAQKQDVGGGTMSETVALGELRALYRDGALKGELKSVLASFRQNSDVNSGDYHAWADDLTLSAYSAARAQRQAAVEANPPATRHPSKPSASGDSAPAWYLVTGQAPTKAPHVATHLATAHPTNTAPIGRFRQAARPRQ